MVWWRRPKEPRTPAAEPPARSCAVLIGGSAGQENVRVMRTLLLDRTRCRWPAGSITVVLDQDSADLAARLSDLAANTVEEFLLYYTGQVTLSVTGELFLAVPGAEGLAWASVARALNSCPATVRRVILDCSVAGDLDGPRLADLTEVDGVYTLTVADPRLSFSAEFADLVRAGVPDGPPRLTLGALYPWLCRRLLAKDLPVPQQRGSDADISFTANGAARGRVTSLMAEAERCARSISDVRVRESALSSLVLHLADMDPVQAQRIAYSLEDAESQVWALSHLAGQLAATDGSWARRLLKDAEDRLDMVDRRDFPRRQSSVAQAMAALDPHRAEGLARAVHDEFWQGWALERVVWKLAPTDPDRAERVARSITSEPWRASALRNVAVEVAATDLDRARRITSAISRGNEKAATLCRLAAATDSRQAARLLVEAGRVASSISDESYRAWALSDVAKATAASDPERAERLAFSISDQRYRVWALIDVALEVYDHEPDRTDRLIAQAERAAHSIVNSGQRVSTVAYLAQRFAATHPDRAQRLLQDAEQLRSEIGEPWKTESVVDLVKAWAALDPDRAERLTHTITDRRSRADALCAIAVAEHTVSAR